MIWHSQPSLLVGPVGLVGLVGLVGQVGLIFGITFLFDLIKKYFEMDILGMMIQKNFMIPKSLIVKVHFK